MDHCNNSHTESVTAWIDRVRVGDDAAAENLWNRYFDELVKIGSNQLRNVPQAAADADDVAISAFKSFCRRAEGGEFPNLANRTQFWKLLLTITIRKAIKQAEREKRRRTLDGSTILKKKLLSPELSADALVEIEDHVEFMLGRLQDPNLERIAFAKLEGHTNVEIAELLGISIATVERKLRLIRRIWTEEDLV